MKDSIYESYGFGCHCRNCQFRVVNKHDESICRRGVFVPQNITKTSFCSEGLPKYVKVDRFGASTLEKAISAIRREVATEMKWAYAKMQVDCNGCSKEIKITVDSSDLASFLVYGIEPNDMPKKLSSCIKDDNNRLPMRMQAYMGDGYRHHYRVNASDLIMALEDEVKSIQIMTGEW